MGGKNSNPTRKVNHFFFGDVVKKKSFNKEVIVVTREIMDKQAFDEWKEKYDLVHAMNKENIFVPEDFEYRKIKNQSLNCRGCCGAEAEYEMTYENVDFTLQSEILNRKHTKQMYTEAQLFHILYVLLRGAKQFQKRGMSIGDVRTKNIFVTKQSELKLVNVASFPNERTSIQKVLENFDTKTVFYFAPQQVQYVMSRGAAKSQYPNPKTEAWSIGLCLLEAATLELSEDIYEMPSRKIDEMALNRRLKKVQDNYKIFADFLAMIVKVNAEQRMTTGQCWASLRPYSEKILELQPFKRNQVAQNTSIRKYQTEGSAKF